MLKILDGLGGVLQDNKMRRAVTTALCDSTRKHCDSTCDDENDSSTRQRSTNSRLPGVGKGLTLEKGEELRGRGLQNLRTRTYGSLDAKAVADAVQKLDLAEMLVTRPPSQQLGAVAMIGE